jgi:two-component system sensor histidine kinase/response regulator
MRAAVAKAMERHAIAGEIRQTNHTLENLKAEIGSLSSQMELMRMQGEIYASIIHDINSPLAAILGYANLIAERIAAVSCLEGRDLSRVKSQMAVVTKQLKNCGEISRRYLRFLHDQRPECTSTSINQILADLGHLLAVHPSARNHHLVIDPSPAEVEARVNGAELMQVMLNLAINGFQSTPQEHEVKIRGETLRQPLDLSRFTDGIFEGLVNRQGFQNTPPLAALSVHDTGPGIPPEILPRMFDSFFTTKPEGLGSGLGLSIVRRIVTDAHGALYFRSQPGSGTRFTLFLPAQEKAGFSSTAEARGGTFETGVSARGTVYLDAWKSWT